MTNHNDIMWLQWHFASDALPIYKGAIGGLEIYHKMIPIIVLHYLKMMTTYFFIVDNHIVVAASAYGYNFHDLFSLLLVTFTKDEIVVIIKIRICVSYYF